MSSKPDTTSIHRALDLTAKKKKKKKKNGHNFKFKWIRVETKGIKNWIPLIMGYNRKGAALFNSDKQMRPMHSRKKYFILKPKPILSKRREIFSSCPHREKQQNFQLRGNEKQQCKVGTATKHLSHTRRERRTCDTLVLRLKHQCRMKRI